MIIINNKKYGSGSSIVVSNNKVIIDGEDVTPDAKEISIKVEGSIESIRADCCDLIEITGGCQDISTKNGNIEICGSVEGSVYSRNGNISCGNVGGPVAAKNGNIKYKK